MSSAQGASHFKSMGTSRCFPSHRSSCLLRWSSLMPTSFPVTATLSALCWEVEVLHLPQEKRPQEKRHPSRLASQSHPTSQHLLPEASLPGSARPVSQVERSTGAPARTGWPCGFGWRQPSVSPWRTVTERVEEVGLSVEVNR